MQTRHPFIHRVNPQNTRPESGKINSSLETESQPSGNSTQKNVLHSQQTIGNQAVMRTLGVIPAYQGIIQRTVKARVMGKSEKATEHSDLDSLCAKFGVEKQSLVAPMKAKLFEGGLFPQVYKDNYDANSLLQEEMKEIVFGADDLVAAANSRSEIVAGQGDATAIVNQLYPMIGAGFTQVRLNGYGNYYATKTLRAQDATIYKDMLSMASGKLAEYEAQIDLEKYDAESRAQNEQMANRIKELKAKAEALKTELGDVLRAGRGQRTIDPVIAKVRTLTADIEQFEHAWDLDFELGEQGIDDKVDTLAGNPLLGDHYEDDGGTDDGMKVKDAYGPLLACTLFSILAVKGTWLGTDDPRVLHSILRKTGKLKDYDDNKVAAKVRYLAGMTPTVVGNKTLKTYLADQKKAGKKDSFIADTEGIAHTFAAVWDEKGKDFVKSDETGSKGDIHEYDANKVLAVWK